MCIASLFYNAILLAIYMSLLLLCSLSAYFFCWYISCLKLLLLGYASYSSCRTEAEDRMQKQTKSPSKMLGSRLFSTQRLPRHKYVLRLRMRLANPSLPWKRQPSLKHHQVCQQLYLSKQQLHKQSCHHQVQIRLLSHRYDGTHTVNHLHECNQVCRLHPTPSLSLQD